MIHFRSYKLLTLEILIPEGILDQAAAAKATGKVRDRVRTSSFKTIVVVSGSKYLEHVAVHLGRCALQRFSATRPDATQVR